MMSICWYFKFAMSIFSLTHLSHPRYNPDMLPTLGASFFSLPRWHFSFLLFSSWKTPFQQRSWLSNQGAFANNLSSTPCLFLHSIIIIYNCLVTLPIYLHPLLLVCEPGEGWGLCLSRSAFFSLVCHTQFATWQMIIKYAWCKECMGGC